jgi:hypothetical protein
MASSQVSAMARFVKQDFEGRAFRFQLTLLRVTRLSGAGPTIESFHPARQWRTTRDRRAACSQLRQARRSEPWIAIDRRMECFPSVALTGQRPRSVPGPGRHCREVASVVSSGTFKPATGFAVTDVSHAARRLSACPEESIMSPLPIPTQTPKALQWLSVHDAGTDRMRRALLANIDGHRNVIELESFARAMGLEADALERLRRDGLIDVTS